MKLFFVLIFIGTTVQGQEKQVNAQKGLEAFQKIHQVFTQRRCTNCHSSTQQPLVGDRGKKHPMYIHSNSTCVTCHQVTNSPQKYGPPGAPHWSMPSSAKAFSTKTSPKTLCNIIKDPEKNFFESGPRVKQPRNLDDLFTHLQTDTLVKWSWDPGPGRQPAPGTHQQFVSLIKTWIEGGAPCPP
jgi:hypothetical protein